MRKALDEGIDEGFPLRPPDTNVGKYLIQKLSDHVSSLHVTAALRHMAVKPRHWTYLITVAGELQNICNFYILF